MKTRVLTGNASEVIAGLTDVERRLSGVKPSAPGTIVLRTSDPRGYYVASTFLNFEREVRRASADMKKGNASQTSCS